ncbi:MAG: helix-turn-helix transcriptional regulator [Oscillospiraceae bacterium]|nr:helix-turn-helix transcriptional regulator [Oscillospiraceae bacterium]
MANKVGPLIKEARTKAGLSQESLARKVDGLSASDLGKAERGEKELTQSVLKLIAKATGVTQSSLIEAAKASTYSTAAKKTTAAAKKTTTAAKKTTTASTAKKSSAKSMELTAAEKKLVELYRAADTDTRKNAVAVLKGEASVGSDLLNSLLGGAMDLLSKK